MKLRRAALWMRGCLNTVWWKYFRSRQALARRTMLDELVWCGKPMPPGELEETVDFVKGRVRW